MKKRSKLRLVHNGDPADVFNDLDALRNASQETEKPKREKRDRWAHTFARIPHDKAMELHRQHQLSGAAWVILIELDRIILAHRGQNPVLLNSTRLRNSGISNATRHRALRQLEAAGVIEVEQRGSGRSPLVTHFWFPRRKG